MFQPLAACGMTVLLLGCVLLLAWLARQKRERGEESAPQPRRTWYQQHTERTREEERN